MPQENPQLKSSKIGQETREYESKELFQGQKAIVIRHEGERYRLFLTRNNRLILQK